MISLLVIVYRKAKYREAVLPNSWTHEKLCGSPFGCDKRHLRCRDVVVPEYKRQKRYCMRVTSGEGKYPRIGLDTDSMSLIVD